MTTEKVKWAQLRARVRESRRLFSPTAIRVPTNFSFRKCYNDAKGVIFTRIYFLAAAQVGRENTIMYVDIYDASVGDSQLTWHSLIDLSFQPGAASKISKEEQLMLERKRQSWSLGISSYNFHSKTGKFIFPSSGRLFSCQEKISVAPQIPVAGANGTADGEAHLTAPVIPLELKTCTDKPMLNATPCPINPNLVAFVCNGDIWLHNAHTNQEVRLTYCHSGETACPISAGLPAYITLEEFGRFEGFWWMPCLHEGKYMILYEEVDETDVDLVKFPTSICGDVEEFRFPRAGTNNAHSLLKLIRFGLGPNGEVTLVEQLGLMFPLETVFPWLEYVVRVGWTPQGKHVWAQILDRKQHILKLILIPREQFVPRDDILLHHSDSYENGFEKVPMKFPPQYHAICTSQSESWINVTDILEFSPCEEPNHIQFIWASEESGWRHLYLITAQLFSSPKDTPKDNLSDYFLRPQIVNQVALTSGEWAVLDKPLKVNWKLGLVFFRALKDSPLEKHLYVVSMNQPGIVKRLTELGFSHSAYVDDECSMFVTTFSSIQSLPACQVFRIAVLDATVDGVVAIPEGWLLAPTVLDTGYQPPELFQHQISDGVILHGMIFKPPSTIPGEKYPVVLSIYGGPEVQLVSNTFKGIRQMRCHLLALQGYCVIIIDSRGSHLRGVSFESHIRLKMGQVELADQIEVLQWLGSTTGFLDMSRIAIHGWSYGGYLSLMALARYPEIFKVAVAGAPVTDWSLYDTAYTERYMDLPENNPAGYHLGSILNYGNSFPDEPNRLLIAHGVMDENVHFFQHTLQLISMFIRCGKPYRLQIFPDERHSLRHLEASEHFETTFLSFLMENL